MIENGINLLYVMIFYNSNPQDIQRAVQILRSLRYIAVCLPVITDPISMCGIFNKKKTHTLPLQCSGH